MKFLIQILLVLSCFCVNAQTIAVNAGASYGNYRVFGIQEGESVQQIGFEFDYPLRYDTSRVRVEYAGEIIPVVLLKEQALKSTLYGVDVEPYGFRVVWRPTKKIEPYVYFKGGLVYFNQLLDAPFGTHVNFTAHSGFGIQTPLAKHWQIRWGLWSDLHISNANIGQKNPGLDVMSSDVGFAYSLR